MPADRIPVTCFDSPADNPSLDLIRQCLGRRRRRVLPPGLTPAAVLLPIFCRTGGWQILFTKRTDTMTHHRGEISFPGGVRHEEDPNLLSTALRETWEEVGIDPGDVELLGVLDDIESVHGYLVTPFVGRISGDYRFTPNPEEIDRLLVVPLEHLRKPDIYREEDWSWKGRKRPVPFFTCGTDEVWGLTAAILRQFIDLVCVPRTD